jgi:hypothetical protein
LALIPVGLALGAYAGVRAADHARRPRRLRQLLRARRGAARQCGLPPAAEALTRRRADLQAGSWALTFCVGSYAVPILTPAALALAIYSMLPLLRAGERALVRDAHPGDDAVNVVVCVGALGLGQPLAAAVQCWVNCAADVAVLGSRERARRLLDAGLPTPTRARVTVAGRDTTLARVQRILRAGAGHQTALQLKAEAIADAASLPLLGVSALAWPVIGPSAALAILFSAPVNAVRAAGALAVSKQLGALLGEGVLVKDGRALEALATVDTVRFDKTGTLTSDALLVTEVVATGVWEPARVLAAAAGAEARLTHPLARALTAAAAQSACEPLHATATDFRVGFGVTAVIDGAPVLVGGRPPAGSRHRHRRACPARAGCRRGPGRDGLAGGGCDGRARGHQRVRARAPGSRRRAAFSP